MRDTTEVASARRGGRMKQSLKRWMWFVGLWAAGVMTVAAGAWAIKLLLGI